MEKVSLSMAFRQGLVGPERQVNSVNRSMRPRSRKGIRLIFLNLEFWKVVLQNQVSTRDDCGECPVEISSLPNEKLVLHCVLGPESILQSVWVQVSKESFGF